MKLYIKLLVVLFLFTGNACNKKDDLSPEEQLPEATQTGANTAGCLVDGEVHLPRGGGISSGSILKAQYLLKDDTYIFGLGIVDNNGNINISYRGQPIEEGKKYLLVEKSSETASASYMIGVGGSENGFETNNDVIGELIIVKLNEADRIVSGKFWFNAENGNGKIVEVREGRFDMRYMR